MMGCGVLAGVEVMVWSRGGREGDSGVMVVEVVMVVMVV